MKISGYINYTQNNANLTGKKRPDMREVQLKPEQSLTTDRLELSSERAAQEKKLNAPDHISIEIPRAWTIGGETSKSANENMDKILKEAEGLSYGERMEFIREEREKWVNDIRRNDPEMFVEWLKMNQYHIENGRPDLAGLPRDFTMADFYSYVKDRPDSCHYL